MIPSALRGRLIALPETRELDLFAALLERRGARVLRAPLVAIRDAPDPAPVLAWVRACIAGRWPLLVLLTGEGLRRLLSCVAQHDPSLRDPFVAALGATCKLTRGPKPARALRELGLRSDVEAPEPTTAGVIAALRTLELAGRDVGVQLYGSEPNLPLREFLAAAGAAAHCVAPYAYADAADDAAVLELIERMRDGQVDAIAFTSKAQLDRLLKVCGAEATRTALAGTRVAAVGPVVAAALRDAGVTVAAQPAASWHLKPLTSELGALFAALAAQA
jgi:uroporphyrinogen-III synthase